MSEERRTLGQTGRLLFWAVLFFGGMGFFAYRVVAIPPKATESPSIEEIRSEKGIPVVPYVVTADPWELWKRFYGPVRPGKEQRITSLLRERILTVAVDVNDPVKKGAVLIELRAESQAADLSARKADYEDAQREYERQKALLAAGGASQQDVDRAWVAVQQKKALMKDVRSEVAKSRVVADLDGVVTFRNAEPGEAAEGGAELLRIADLKNLEVEVGVPPADDLRLRPGTPARVMVERRLFQGKIKRQDPGADPATGLYKALVALEPGAPLRPGMVVEVDLLVDSRDRVVAIPYEALRRENAKTFVFVLSGDRATRREVEVGEGQGGQVEILSRLYSGDVIIAEGTETLFDGARVWIRPPGDPRESPEGPSELSPDGAP